MSDDPMTCSRCGGTLDEPPPRCPVCQPVKGADSAPPVAGLPKFPDIGCAGECGFVVAGVGLQCREGSACGFYLHPGDKHHAAVADYYRRVDAADSAPPAVLDHGGGPADMASSKLAQDRDDVRLARAVLSYFTARPDGKCAACEAPAPDTSRESVGATCYSDCPVPVAREIAERLGVWPIKPRSAAQAPAAEQGPPLSPSVAGPSLLDLAREFCRQIVARWNAAFRLARALLSSPAPTSQEIGARMRRFDAQWGLSSPAVPRGLTEEERREVELIRRTCTGLEQKLLRIIDRLTAEAPRTEGDADGR